MVQRSTCSLVLAAGAASCGAVATQARPVDEFVFDFRPRIVEPASTARPRDPLSLQRDVHLHVYRQPAGAPDCSGSGRTPVEQGQVAVVLSGGISKGLAFIGALQVLDQVGIRVDKIAGTSMGAVVGALYAAGYSPTRLYAGPGQGVPLPRSSTDILGDINWRTLFTDIPDVRALTLNQQMSWGLGEGSTALPRVYQGGLRSGQNLQAFLGKYLMAATAASAGCFDNLYVPFRAMVTDINDARSVTLRDGDLAAALRASLSFPVLLTPTFRHGSRYIDGGVLNNYPVGAILDDAPPERREKRQRPATEAAATEVAARATPAATAAPPAQPRFRAILGFDVSDTNAPNPQAPSLLPLVNVFGAIAGAQDAIGVAISRETERSRESRTECPLHVAPAEDSENPCLMHFKFGRGGGFTDFARVQIDTFVADGRTLVTRELCRRFAPQQPACAELTARDAPAAERLPSLELKALPEIREGIRRGPWRFLLHDRQQTIRFAAQHAPLGALQPRERLRRLREAMAATTVPQVETLAAPAWPGVLQGLQLTLDADGRVRWQASAKLADGPLRAKLVEALRRTVEWMDRQLDAAVCAVPPCAGDAPEDLPDFEPMAGVRVIVAPDRVVVRATSWQYHVSGLVVTASELSDQRQLQQARVDLWQVEPAAQERYLRQAEGWFEQPVRSRLCGPAMPTPCLGGAAAAGMNTVTLGNGRPSDETALPRRWKHEIGHALHGQTLDIRYFRDRQTGECRPAAAGARSLPCLFEGLQERYYANAAVEYFRLDSLSADLLELTEKPTSRTVGGSVFVGYQYDYRNKHTFGLRHVYETRNDHWYKPTRIVTSVAANEPAAGVDGMMVLDARFLYFPSIERNAADYSVNPTLARRNQRVGKSIPEFAYEESGLTITVSGRAGNEVDYLTPYAGWHGRRLGDVQSTDVDAIRRMLRDPGLGEERRRFDSLYGGLRWVLPWEGRTLAQQMQFAWHRANGATTAEITFDGSIEFAAGPAPDAALWGVSWFLGKLGEPRDLSGPRPGRTPPTDELYSLGGYYPLAERTLWGRKRIDYLGRDINDRWGTRVVLLDVRRSLTRWTPVTYFAPYAKVQVDAVLQSANIGFTDDPARAWRMATGVVLSGYIPPIASIRPRLSMAVGGESRRRVRFFSSVDLLL